MKFIKKNLFVMFLLAIVVLIPILSFADTDTEKTPSATIVNPIRVSTVNEFIKILLEGVIKIGLPIVALAIIYSGFLFVSARGNSKTLETARNSLLYSVIGAALLLGAWGIAQLISDTVLKLK